MSPHNQQTPSAPVPADGTAAATPSYSPPATTDGTLFPAAGDRYILGDEIARGGMGAVYRATDTALCREVAVKTLLPGQDRMAFVEEARITGQLQHPHIPAVHDLGTLPDGRVFLAMKLIKGDTLQHLLGRPDRSINVPAVFEAICQALGYAHSHRVVHRDLKPLNVMVGAFGEVQVMDWGLAKVLSADPSTESTDSTTAPGTAIVSVRAADDATVDGVAKGTIQYMSPEQARGVAAEIDQRSDVFGLGGILCALLTGKPVYIGNSRLGTALMASNGETSEAFARLDASGADPALVALCKRCLATHKEDRPADGNTVAAEVAGIRADAEERARQAELDRVRAEEKRKRQTEQVRADRARRRLQTWAAAAVGVVLVIGTGLSLWQADRANTEAKRADDRAVDAEREQKEAERQRGLASAAAMRAGEEAKRADDRAAEAERERETAKVSDRAARQMVGRIAVAEGIRLADTGEVAQSLAWFARSREVDAESAVVDLAANRLASYQRYGRLPTLTDMSHIITNIISTRSNYYKTNMGRIRINVENDENINIYNVYIIDNTDSKSLTKLSGHGGYISSATFSPDGGRVLTASSDGTARVWDAYTGRTLITIASLTNHTFTKFRTNMAVFSPDGRWVVTLSDSIARAWDATSGQPITPPLWHERSVFNAAFSSDGRQLSTLGYASDDGKHVYTTRVWDLSACNINKWRSATSSLSRHHVSGEETRKRLPFAPLNELDWKRLPFAIRHERTLQRFGYSPDSRQVMTTHNDHTARVWDAETGIPISPPLQHSDAVLSTAFSSDGRRVVTASLDGKVRVWDTATGQLVAPPIRPRESAYFARFSPDGRLLTTCNGEYARVWDVTSSQPITPPMHHDGFVWSAVFSSDGRRVSTASADRTARVWDAACGQPITPPLRHQDEVLSVEFSPDDRQLVTECKGSKGHIWELPTDTRPTADLIKLAHLYAGGRVDDAGGFVRLTYEETKKLFAELKAKYPADFTVTPQQAVNWHREQLDAAAADKDWFAVAFHLRVLLGQYAFADVELALRLKAAEAELQKPAPAPRPAR